MSFPLPCPSQRVGKREFGQRNQERRRAGAEQFCFCVFFFLFLLPKVAIGASAHVPGEKGREHRDTLRWYVNPAPNGASGRRLGKQLGEERAFRKRCFLITFMSGPSCQYTGALASCDAIAGRCFAFRVFLSVLCFVLLIIEGKRKAKG